MESAGWAANKNQKSAKNEVIEVKFGSEGTVNVLVAQKLKEIEQQILEGPSGALTWRMRIVRGVPQTWNQELTDWPEGGEVDAFLAARAAYFQEVKGESGHMISQGAELSALQETVVTYASAYVNLVKSTIRQAEISTGHMLQKALTTLRTILALDSISLVVQDHGGGNGQQP